MKTFIILIFIVVFLSSCKRQEKFDKQKWNVKSDMEYPFRNNMLNDLTSNYKLAGMSYAQIINLLDSPDFKENNKLGYTILEDYGQDIDPIRGKNLIFTMSNDTIVSTFNIDEWKNK